MRDKDGWIVSEHFPKIVQKDAVRKNLDTIIMPLHLYQNYDVRSFKEAINEKLIDDNGWYGFSNPSTLGTSIVLKDDDNNEYISRLNINKTINNKEYCEHIDMYPGRDLFSFTPKYNEGRKRLEKNWNYCITYPSKSVIRNGNSDFSFFRIDSSGNTSLKVYMFDEGTVADDGTELVTIYTICQHGLMVGDTINLYKSKDIFYESVEVINVVDKYIFQIYKSNGNISNSWVEVTNRYSNGVNIENSFDGPTPQTILNGVLRVGGNYYPICESNRCNVDPSAQDIHFRRVVNGVECKYYVRIFSRLPNFKYRDEEVNGFTLYDDDQVKNNKKRRRIDEPKLSLIERFSKPGDPSCEFESHVAKLGFANTSYGDDATEIVFTDDIDTSYLRDNLGRPLSDLFITIVKNNKGYKEWYGIGKEITIEDINVEYSHCFGKVNSSFLLSEYFREYYKNDDYNGILYDVRDITANPEKIKSLVNNEGNDEIEFDKDWDYFGDICCFSPVDCDEQSIQYAMHRFNTVQREMKTLHSNAKEKFNSGVMFHDEIYDVENTLQYTKTNKGDPYALFEYGSNNPSKKSDIDSTKLYHTTREELSDMLNFPEGYYYQPHYRIPIKTVSRELKTDKSIEYEITEVVNPAAETVNERTLFEIKTKLDNSFRKNEKLVLYKRSINKYYFVTVYDLIDFNRFTCVIADEEGNHVDSIDGFFDIKNINDYILLKKNDDTPDYARLINDGSCRYCWRNILSNGIESNENVYPFANGAFYINRKINFFLRRQDPKKTNLGFVGEKDYVPDGEDIRYYPNFNPIDKTNYESSEIAEC